jgi:amino acid adenylation domain-containing protein
MAALTALVERHEVLRTRLVADADGVPYQLIDPPAPFDLPVVDLGDASDPQAAVRERIAVDAATPFDLAIGAIRGVLYRLGQDEHVLGLCMHHVVSDDWSARILYDELDILYRAFRDGVEPALAPLPVQYADFAVWQRGWLTGEVLDRQLGYWRERLAGAPVLDLPTDRPRPAVRSAAGDAVEFVVPAGVADGLRVVSREAGATMFMTLFAAYAVLLSRYTGQDDIVVGTPIANRNRAEIEGLIGFFVNTLVLRTDLSGDPSFNQLLGQVRRTALEAYGHQDIPFERLVDELVTDRDRSRTPLYQAFFSLLDGGDGEAGAPARQETTACDLTVSVASVGSGGLVGVVEYATGLFERVSMQRLAERFVGLLTELVAAPGVPLSGLPGVGAAELVELDGWQHGPVLPVLPGSGVHGLIEGWAVRTPDAVAVECGSEWLTFGELDRRAGGLALVLRGRGVGVESVVGVCVGRGVGVVVAALAVWKVGAVFLPLDPAYPQARREAMVADAGAVLVLTDADLVDVADADVAGVVVGGDGAACVIFTSGSTGRPKGTVVTHGGLLGVFGGWQGAHFGSDGRYRWLSLTNVSFDVFTGDVVRALGSGGTLVLGGVGLQLSVADWVAVLVERRIGALECAARYADELVEYVAGVGVGLVDLRLLVVTTEVWRSGAAARAVAVLGAGVRVLAGYGITETTIDSTWADLGVPDVVERAAPIGRPLPGVTVRVLDGSLRPVPVGGFGEVFIGGLGVARGYVGRPELTAQRFVADPFGGVGGRLYRSGDRARWRADGQLVFAGRVDEQVKVRGYRIEPGEIRAVLVGVAGVADAAVVVDGDRLVAYVVPVGGIGLNAAELGVVLRGVLPEYMVPARFVWLAALPLSPNGKVDVAALPALGSARPEVAAGYVAPVTPAEQALAAIWTEVLAVDPIGSNDNFFELGGHSLLANRVTTRIRTRFGVEVPLAAVFEQPTIHQLAGAIEALVLAEIEQMSDEEAHRNLQWYSDARRDENGATS